MFLSIHRALCLLLCFFSLTSYSADQSELNAVLQRARKKLHTHYPNPRARNHKVLYAIFNDFYVKATKLHIKSLKMMAASSCWEHRECTRIGELVGQEYTILRQEAVGDIEALLPAHELSSGEATATLLVLTTLFIKKYNEHHPLAHHQCDTEGRSASCKSLRNYVTHIQLPFRDCLTKAVAYQKTYPKTFATLNGIMDSSL